MPGERYPGSGSRERPLGQVTFWKESPRYDSVSRRSVFTAGRYKDQRVSRLAPVTSFAMWDSAGRRVWKLKALLGHRVVQPTLTSVSLL